MIGSCQRADSCPYSHQIDQEEGGWGQARRKKFGEYVLDTFPSPPLKIPLPEGPILIHTGITFLAKIYTPAPVFCLSDLLLF